MLLLLYRSQPLFHFPFRDLWKVFLFPFFFLFERVKKVLVLTVTTNLVILLNGNQILAAAVSAPPFHASPGCIETKRSAQPFPPPFGQTSERVREHLTIPRIDIIEVCTLHTHTVASRPHRTNIQYIVPVGRESCTAFSSH